MENALSQPELSDVKPLIERIYEKWTQIGWENGWEKGMAAGREAGLEQGLEKGLEQGLEKGVEQGLEQGYVRLLAVYIEKFPQANNSEIAALFNISVEMVEKARHKNA